MAFFPTSKSSRADQISMMVNFIDSKEPIKFLEHLGENDVYVKGEPGKCVMMIVPGIWTGMPPDLLEAMRARRLSSFTGRCSMCDACIMVSTGTYMHESYCPVHDDNLYAAINAWEFKVGRFAKGKRIQEIPS